MEHRFKTSPLAAIAIVGLGALLRFYNLGGKSLWVDEISHYQESGAMGSYQVTLDYALSHAQPPLSYFVYRWYQRLLSIVGGDLTSDFAARLPAAIFGILVIPVAYFLGKKLLSEREGLIAAFLVAVSTLQVWYSQEARHYSMIALFALLSMFYFYRALTENTRKDWILYVAFATLASYTHAFALFIVACQGMFLVSCWLLKRVLRADTGLRHVDQRTLIRASTSMLAIVLVFAPMALMMRSWAEPGAQHLVPPALTGRTLLGVFGELSLMTNTHRVSFDIAQGPPLSYLLIALAFIGLIAALFRNTLGGLYLLFMSFLLTFVVMVAFNYAQMDMRVRYIIFVSPPFLVLVARGFTVSLEGISSKLSKRLPGKNWGLILPVTIAVLLVGGLSLVPLAESYALEKINFRAAARYIEERMSPDDLVLFSDDTNTRFGMQRYLAKPGKGLISGSSGIGIWYVLVYGSPPKSDQFGVPFDLVKSFPGENTVSVYYARISAHLRPLEVPNPSFEADDNGDGLPDGWGGAQWAGTTHYSLDDGVASEGKRSVKLVARSDGVNFGLVSEPVPVTSGKLYYLSGKTKSGDRAGLEIQFLDSKGSQVLLFGGFPVTSGQWVELGVGGVVPERAVRAALRLRLYGSQRAGETVWFDDIRLYGEWDLPPPTPTPTPLPRWTPRESDLKELPNAGFEDDNGTKGLPDGWGGAQWGGSADYALDEAVFVEGRRSVRLETRSAGVNFGLLSGPLPLVPGKGYYISGKMKKSTVAIPSNIEVQFLDSQKQHVAYAGAGVVAAGEWMELGLRGTVPAGAAYAVLRLRIFDSQRAGEVVWFDDVRFYGEWETAPMPTPTPLPTPTPTATPAPTWTPSPTDLKGLPNGSFEEDKATVGLPDAWGGAQWGGSADYTLDDSVYAEGKRSVRLDALTPGVNFGLISQPIAITSGKEYYVSGKMKKGSETIPSKIEVQFLDQDKGQVRVATAEVLAAGEWMELGLRGIVSQGATYAAIPLQIDGSQRAGETVWFDDIKFYGNWTD